MSAEALPGTTNSQSCCTSRQKTPKLCHHPLLLLQERDCYLSLQILLQVMFVNLVAVSNTCTDGLHVSEFNTEFLELS